MGFDEYRYPLFPIQEFALYGGDSFDTMTNSDDPSADGMFISALHLGAKKKLKYNKFYILVLLILSSYSYASLYVLMCLSIIRQVTKLTSHNLSANFLQEFVPPLVQDGNPYRISSHIRSLILICFIARFIPQHLENGIT